ncbi:hypothetical protein HMPREF1568_0247 [Providencia alcalifaciens PAL-3]|nr:hypothetical protein HMPREF1568_0247 [Providencia alcalifaciens PAL-3]EUD01074.1 hypothetical protein HMPREF1566_2836 [Providencia alcalifaciens PAL-1]
MTGKEKTRYIFRCSGFLFGAGYRSEISKIINLILLDKAYTY